MRKKEVPILYLYLIHILLLLALIGSIFSLFGQPISLKAIFSSELRVATVAHRGASGYAPEHTISAYQTAVRSGSDYLEIDLQMTKDGELIAMHDETVNRTTNGRGRVSTLTWGEIQTLDAGSWFNELYPMYAREEFVNEKVPTLREIFETFGNEVNYMLETKAPSYNPGLEEKMIALVEEFKLVDHVAVQSFSKSSLQTIHQMNEDIELFQLLWYNTAAFITNTTLNEIKQYATGISPNFQQINSSYVQKVQSAGLLVFPYTVNYQVNMAKAVSWGVDGVHTDYPDRLKEVIKEKSEIR
ncbi:MAG: glycerophosphodiester phosphodiesterase [Candidatus Pristimantibacillus sp.]